MNEQQTQAAMLPDISPQNGKNLGDKYETIRTMKIVAYVAEEPYNAGFCFPVEARFYRSRSGDGAAPIHCSVWIHTKDGRHISGAGKAGGYGYCKVSAALDAALASAGVELARRIDGAGISAAWGALEAVAVRAGWGVYPMGRVD